MKALIKFLVPIIWLAFSLPATKAQTGNLLQNTSANDGTLNWHAYGAATVEKSSNGDWHFVVRNKGYFLQDVTLPEGSMGKYALLIGRVSSERINPDGAITGLPYLYGYMMERASQRGCVIKAYLQGRELLCRAGSENEWVPVWGIFCVPPGTGAIRFFLNQAEQKGVPQNGSAARFDDLGLYLFATEEEARAFVEAYKEQKH